MVETGDPVILTDATGLEDFDLADGQLGWANSVAVIPGDKTYVFFMPDDRKELFVVDASRVVVDLKRKEKGLELNENTLPKGNA